MKNTELNEAFLYVDDRYLDMVNFTHKEDNILTRDKRQKRFGKVIIIAAAVALFAVMGTVAYAQNLWGIREMWSGTSSQHPELPKEAAEYIQRQDEAFEGEGWSCRLTETLCDANTAMATVTVFGGDRYVVVPTDCSPMDKAASAGFEGDCTLAEYAEAQGKELLFVSAHISCEQDIFGSGFMHFESISDSEMVILTSCDKTVSTELTEAVCTVYANDRSVELAFPITEGYTKDMGLYVPENPDAVSGISVGEATVLETTLGISVRFPVYTVDGETLGDIAIASCVEIADFNSGGFVMGKDGVWYARMNLGQGALSDTLTVRFCDLSEKPIGDIVFKRK